MPYIILAQINFSRPKPVDSYKKSNSVFSIDIDSDGDIDIVSGGGDGISWYENTNGVGLFKLKQTITNRITVSVHVTDIDIDNYLDIISIHVADNIICWYENIDGKGNFGPLKTIVSLEKGSSSMYAKDLDGDNDVDVLSVSIWDDKVVWYENTDGKGSFGSEIIIDILTDLETSGVISCDIDGGSDNDVVACAWDGKIVWYENFNGEGKFNLKQILSLTHLAGNLFYIDMDGDSDIDIIAASPKNDRISWYENLDCVGIFGQERIIYTRDFHNENTIQSIFAIDLDSDGDADVLSASEKDNKIAWYENTDGTGTFSEQQTIAILTNGATSVYSADLDHDGDQDVISGSRDGGINWFENKTTTNIQYENRKPYDFTLNQNYPNPFNHSTTICFTLQKSEHISLKVYNVSGQEVAVLVDDVRSTGEHYVQWLADSFPSGIYFYKLQAGDFSETKKLIMQK